MPNQRTELPFEQFAARFVRAYWQTVKEQRFPMPPNEPIAETLDEILSAVTYDAEHGGHRGSVTMHSGGSWWRFGFRVRGGMWMLETGRAESLDPQRPHDLMARPYRAWFGPFLTFVTAIGNGSTAQTAAASPTAPAAPDAHRGRSRR